MVEGIAIAALALAATSMVAAITFAVMNSSARDQREAARVLASGVTGELRQAKDAISRLTDDLKSEQERADALDDELAKTYDTPDPVGARDRVLAKWQRAHDAARGRASAVSAPITADEPGPDDLLKPGD